MDVRNGKTQQPSTVVLDAAQHALTRLYPHFDLADDPRWDKIIERARRGDGSALEVLGYHGDPGNHPVCSALFKEIGAGKKGRDLRRHFSNSPYGWPQDAIDGALLVLCVTEKVKATQDGKPVEIRQLDQTRIGVAEFRTEQTTVTTGQRLAIRKLLQEAGVDFKPQEESAVAGEFLRRMLALAESAGGEAPLPARPDIKHLHQLRSLAGNEQLVALYNECERLVGEVQAWQHAKALIQARWPRWETLHQLLDHARGLPVLRKCIHRSWPLLSSAPCWPNPTPYLACANNSPRPCARHSLLPAMHTRLITTPIEVS